MKYIRIVFVFCILSIYHDVAESQVCLQYDTVYFDLPELKVNQKSFLRTLNAVIRKTSFCEEKKVGEKNVNVVYVKKYDDEKFMFSIVQSSIEYSKFHKSKFFFVLKDRYFFVMGDGSLAEFPKGLFSVTENVQTFYDLRLEDVMYIDGAKKMDLMYKKKRLSLIREY